MSDDDWSRRAAVLGIACGTAAVPLMCRAQARLVPGARGPTSGLATRDVSAYLGLERQLADAIERHDGVAARSFLSADFEFHSADLADALTADAWLALEWHASAGDATVRNLSVRGGSETASVGFLLDRESRARDRRRLRTFYVVDVWHQASHRLLARYVSEPAHALPRSIRPTGRD